jgi:hypothetical protein
MAKGERKIIRVKVADGVLVFEKTPSGWYRLVKEPKGDPPIPREKRKRGSPRSH